MGGKRRPSLLASPDAQSEAVLQTGTSTSELVRNCKPDTSGIWIVFVVELYAQPFQLALRYFEHEVIFIVVKQGSGRGQLLRSKAEVLTYLHDELTVLTRARENIANVVTVLGENRMTVSSLHFVLGIRTTDENEKEKSG
jgi:hypothetical protein